MCWTVNFALAEIILPIQWIFLSLGGVFMLFAKISYENWYLFRSLSSSSVCVNSIFME